MGAETPPQPKISQQPMPWNQHVTFHDLLLIASALLVPKLRLDSSVRELECKKEAAMSSRALHD